MSKTDPPGYRALTFAILQYAGPALPKAALIVVLAALLEGAGLLLLLPVAETIFAQDPASRSGVTGQIVSALDAMGFRSAFAQLAAMGSAFVLLVVLRAIVLLKRDVLITELSLGFVDRVRGEFFARLAAADWPVIKRFRKAHLLDSMTTNIGRLAQTMQFLSNGIILLALGLAYLAAAFIVSPLLGAAMLTFGMFGLLLAGIWMRRSHRLGQRLNTANLGVMDETTRFLDGMKAAKAARAEEELTRRFGESIAETRRLAADFVAQQSRLRNSIQLVASIVGLLILLVGFSALGLSGAELLVLAAIVVRFAPILSATFNGMQAVAHALPAFQGIRALDSELAVADTSTGAAPSGPPSSPPPVGELSAADCEVDVVGDDGQPVTLLCVGSLSVAPGSLVHISGPSGAGKSTLVELIAGLHLPARGQLRIGDTSLDVDTRRDWQSVVSFAPQEPFLLDASVRENLLWPNTDGPDAKLESALSQAHADELLAALPGKLDAQLLEGGARLSGGERQRICLARALLRPANLLILDEATSALDPELERKVIAGLRENIGQRIILMVSHSLNAAGYADTRIEVSQGVAKQLSTNK